MSKKEDEAKDTPVAQRIDILHLFDCIDGNYNGDPENSNSPRIDPETGQGITSDVCSKRMIRNYCSLIYPNDPRRSIFVEHNINLNRVLAEAHESVGNELTKDFSPNKKQVASAAAAMTKKFIDVRSFGAVMSTGPNCGQLVGPMQFTPSKTFDPVQVIDMSITRVAEARDESDSVENGKKSKKALITAKDYQEYEAKTAENKMRTMGRKAFVPYGLFRGHAFVSAYRAKQTGFTEGDLELVLDGLENGYEHARSASKGLMSNKCLLVFRHVGTAGDKEGREKQAMKGCSHAHRLFALLKVTKKADVEFPRKFEDYVVEFDHKGLPPGVILDPRSHINGMPIK